jgi:predicted nucleic acid-binding protein
VNDVVDASVAVKWYFPEPGCQQAAALLDARLERELLAPDLIALELTNVLRKKVRLAHCQRGRAFEILALWESDRPEYVSSLELTTRALELSLLLDHPVYDCIYIAAAIEHEARLVTADARLALAARAVIAEVELLG